MTDPTEKPPTEIILPLEKKPGALSPYTDNSGGNLIQAIERMAINPNVDIEKMKVLMDMKLKSEDRNAELLFNQSMALCQGEMVPVVKTAYNKHTKSKYAKLEDICRAINTIYASHGFSVTSRTAKSEIPLHFLTITDIRHVAGHKETIHLDLPIDDKGKDGTSNKTSLHGVASTISYARRYSICMGFNVATGDDSDGNQDRDQQEPTQNTITDKQVKELEALIAQSATTAESLCEQAGISQLSEMRTRHFEAAQDYIRKCTEAPQ